MSVDYSDFPNKHPEICHECGKKTPDGKPWAIKQEPNRHACSPNSINHGIPKDYHYFEYLCSDACRKKINHDRYKWFAELDRNASDSECFVHDHWETDSSGRKMRVGKCAITGEVVRVEPLMPSDNSGQPEECTKHFKLRSNYL